MILLLVTLTVTPLNQLVGWNAIFLRRMIGLFVFFYATVHLVSYLVFLLELNFGGFVADVIKRPYITVGLLAFGGLIPLAVTSNRWSQRILRQNWKRLHCLIYIISICVVIHIVWQVRSDFTEALVYGSLFFLLLGYRAFYFFSKSIKKKIA
jgi:sulfoxide reductase heme-binding subunit YedZ